MFYGVYGNLPPVNVLRSNAGVVEASSQNPAYTSTDFLTAFPIFTNKVQTSQIDEWIHLANNVLSYSRFTTYWKLAMGLFIAHNLLLQLKLAGNANDSLNKLLKNGETKGYQTSKGVDALSTSYDVVSALEDYKGWGTLKDTEYGRQLIDIIKAVNGGAMFYVI